MLSLLLNDALISVGIEGRLDILLDVFGHIIAVAAIGYESCCLLDGHY